MTRCRGERLTTRLLEALTLADYKNTTFKAQIEQKTQQRCELISIQIEVQVISQIFFFRKILCDDEITNTRIKLSQI